MLIQFQTRCKQITGLSYRESLLGSQYKHLKHTIGLDFIGIEAARALLKIGENNSLVLNQLPFLRLNSNRLRMENHNPSEPMYFDEATGKIYPYKPNDKAVAVSMNQPGSGGFFAAFHREEGSACTPKRCRFTVVWL